MLLIDALFRSDMLCSLLIAKRLRWQGCYCREVVLENTDRLDEQCLSLLFTEKDSAKLAKSFELQQSRCENQVFRKLVIEVNLSTIAENG